MCNYSVTCSTPANCSAPPLRQWWLARSAKASGVNSHFATKPHQKHTQKNKNSQFYFNWLLKSVFRRIFVPVLIFIIEVETVSRQNWSSIIYAEQQLSAFLCLGKLGINITTIWIYLSNTSHKGKINWLLSKETLYCRITSAVICWNIFPGHLNICTEKARRFALRMNKTSIFSQCRNGYSIPFFNFS